MDKIDDIIDELIVFRDSREWDKFHTPKNLIMALNGEVGELNSLVQWMDNSQIKTNEVRSRVAEEMSDIFIYLVNLSLQMDIDLIHEVQCKISQNARRYPVDLCKGKSTKAEDL